MIKLHEITLYAGRPFLMRTCFVDFMILVHVLWIDVVIICLIQWFFLLLQFITSVGGWSNFDFSCPHPELEIQEIEHLQASLCSSLFSSGIMRLRSMCLFEFKQHAWQNGDCYPWITNLVCIILWNILVDLYDCILELWKRSSKNKLLLNKVQNPVCPFFFPRFCDPKSEHIRITRHKTRPSDFCSFRF